MNHDTREQQQINLKAAAEEIKAILKKYDFAALMTIQAPDQFEYVRELSPSWSCVRLGPLEPSGSCEIRVRCKREDFASKEDQRRCLERTIGMLLGFEHQAKEDTDNMTMLVRLIAPHVGQITNRISKEPRTTRDASEPDDGPPPSRL